MDGPGVDDLAVGRMITDDSTVCEVVIDPLSDMAVRRTIFPNIPVMSQAVDLLS